MLQIVLKRNRQQICNSGSSQFGRPILDMWLTDSARLTVLRSSVHDSHSNDDESTTNKWIMDPIQVSIGPVTRARAKRFKETLNGLVQHIYTKVHSCRPKGKSIYGPTHGPQAWITLIQASYPF